MSVSRRLKGDNVNEHELLDEALESQTPLGGNANVPQPSYAEVVAKPDTTFDFKQWVIGANGTYRPAGPTVSTIPAGVYKFGYNDSGVYLERARVITDDLFVLPDSANDRVLEGMRKFWKSRERYIKHGLIYKRGVLLWGPAGAGKTATLQLMMKQLVDADGAVVISDDPGLTVVGLQAMRRIEPTRNLIVILEDVDETIKKHGEHTLLALLDGENQIDNCVMVATTNYPGLLGARIVNRPSRFDERIFVDMPTPAAREVYLRKVAPGLDDIRLLQWVQDTDKMSVAHLRELAAAVLCLEQDYDEVISRLRAMRIKPRDTEDGFNQDKVGFSLSNQARGASAGQVAVPMRSI